MAKSISNKNILGALTVNSKTVPTISYSDSVPSSPVAGDIWVRTTDMVMFTYYNDGSSSQWTEIRKSDDTNLGARVTTIEATYAPAGVIHQYAGSSVPTGWLLCDGTAVSRTNYLSLFNALGTSYGVGDGSTTFNLPDLRGRIPVGKNSGTFATLGSTGGAETVTLTTNEMPSHTHVQDAHNHTQNAHSHTAGDNGHTHPIFYNSGSGVSDGPNANYPNILNKNAASGTGYASVYVNSTTATNIATTATNQNTGGGGAHNNLQPYIVTNYIIKY